MRIHLRFAAGDRRPVVSVTAAECPHLTCFYPSRHTVRSVAGACSADSADEWACGYREIRGCPDRCERHPAGALYAHQWNLERNRVNAD